MNKKKKYIILFSIIVLTFLFFFKGITFAKYIYNSVWNYYLNSKGFYFSSDYLDVNTRKNVNSIWEGDSVVFNIKNNLNESVITSYDIDYTVKCTITNEAKDYTICKLNGTDNSIITGTLSKFETCTDPKGTDVSSLNKTDCELENYNWTNQIATKNIYFDIIKTDANYDIKDVAVNIEVTSNSPYTKTLKGNFILHKIEPKEEVKLKYKNYYNYDRLTISNNNNNSKCINISWDESKLLIDQDINNYSSYTANENGYIDSIKINIPSNSSLDYTFFPNNLNTRLDVNTFTVSDTTGC